MVCGLLFISTLMSLIGLWSSNSEVELLKEMKLFIQRADELPDEMRVRADENDTRQMLIGLAQLGVGALQGILFLVWIYRSNRNCHALVSGSLTFTPGWSVGYFFIPIMNLFRPYQAMAEIWRASIPRIQRWENAPVSMLIGVWWFLWLVSRIVGQFVLKSALKSETIDELITLSQASMALDALDIPLCIVCIFMLRGINANQEEKSLAPQVDETVAVDAACPGCGEPVDVLIRNCQMCGALLGKPLAPPRREESPDEHFPRFN